MKDTPFKLPWKVVPTCNGTKAFVVQDVQPEPCKGCFHLDGSPRYPLPPGVGFERALPPDLATFVSLACNSHDKLVDACKRLFVIAKSVSEGRIPDARIVRHDMQSARSVLEGIEI